MISIQVLITGAFWICLVLVAYTYFVYPLLIWCLARCFGRRQPPPTESADDLPTVTVLIAAYNEEAVIEARLRNALAMDYPRDKLQIVVASDGSTDSTAAIVRRYAHHGVRLLEYTQRRGKAAVLNAAFRRLTSEIVILSDANTYTEAPAARKLIRWFRDPSVGVVCGRLVLTDPHTGHNVDSLYWKYETFIKQSEGRLGALLGANGAIYAIRRDVFTPIPNDTIIDDLVIPLTARLRTGCALVYDREAVAHEESAPDFGCEFHRRSRIGAGGFQSLGMLWRLLYPRQGWVAFTYCSHKILRWLGPFCLLGLVVSNIWLLTEPFFQGMLGAQLGFYVLSMLGAYTPPQVRPLKPLRLTTMFAGMNLALLLGFWNWLTGRQKAAWHRTVRLAEVNGSLSDSTIVTRLADESTVGPAWEAGPRLAPEVTGTTP
jgi:cellulose synthase/poly-beta-1,6-N-acetylglucosamine synthase-like glycosyltransferase